jgi:hypothetical protein
MKTRIIKNSGLYIEVGRISPSLRKAAGFKRVRDKSIKVKFIYKGNDETFYKHTNINVKYTTNEENL